MQAAERRVVGVNRLRLGQRDGRVVVTKFDRWTAFDSKSVSNRSDAIGTGINSRLLVELLTEQWKGVLCRTAAQFV